MSSIDPLLKGALRMAVEGSSSVAGRSPGWFERSSDVRFVDYSLDRNETVIWLQAPRLGEAAEELFLQKELWDTKPAPEQTALDVLSRVIHEVTVENSESGWFDQALLARLGRLHHLFSPNLQAVRLDSEMAPASITCSVVETASRLGASTPQALRIDAGGVEAGETAASIWTKAPPARSRRPIPSRLRPAEAGKRGVAAFFGTWPGDESDAELAEAVARLRA